jgi:thiamine pyrophosphokinase
VQPDSHTVIVVSSGGRPRPGAPLPDASAVIAADGGIEHARALGLRVDVAVGDFDSAAAEAIEAASRAGARIERHPAEKDATDLELALDTALTFGPHRILVLGADAGRLDHLLAGVLALASESLTGVLVDALLGESRVHVVRGERTLTGEAGELISLLPVGGPAEGVTTEGLRYRLRGETLTPASSRGVSNVFAGKEARISVRRGVLLAIRPGERAEEAP